VEAREAEQALAQVAQRRRQAIDAGAAPWSPHAVWSICSSVLALGILTDAGMIWLWVLLMLMGVGVAWKNGVQLKRTRDSVRWQAALVATFVLAFAAYVGAQFPVRAAEWPLPNTFGALGACAVIVLVSRPVQARLAASLRP
jgi:hypothetical protein